MSVNNMGKPINGDSREAGSAMLKEIGLKSSQDRFECIRKVSEQLERDKPHKAMEIAMEYVDAMGAYRLFAELLVDRGVKA